MLKFVKDMLAQARKKKGMAVYIPELEDLETRLTAAPDDPAANREARDTLLALRPTLKDDLPDPPAPAVVIHPGIANLRQSAGLPPIDPTAAATTSTAPPMGLAPSGSGGSLPPPLPPGGMPPPVGPKASTKLKIPKRKKRTLTELKDVKDLNWHTENPVDKIAEYRPAAIANIRLPTEDTGVVGNRPKQAFLDESKVDEVNAALEASGSFIRMEPVGPAGEDGFVEVRPTVAGSVKDMPGDLRFMSELSTARQEGGETDDPLVAWSDCHKMSQMVMGIKKNSVEKIVFPDGQTLKPMSQSKGNEVGGIKNSEASRMVHSLLGAALPGFSESLVGDTSDKAEDIRSTIKEAKDRQAEFSGKAPLIGRSAYEAILKDIDDPSSHEYEIYDDFCKIFGINHHAVPNVGDAFTIVNDDIELKNRKDAITQAEEDGEDPPPDAWNFHWAGVVAVNDDGTYMTLENTSTEHPGDVNNDWYYAVYDPSKGKDFHSVHKNDKAILGNAMTVLVRGGAK